MDPMEIIKADTKKRNLHAQWQGYAEHLNSIEKEDGNQKQIPIKPVNQKIQNCVSEFFKGVKGL